jgi:hypothetical protein
MYCTSSNCNTYANGYADRDTNGYTNRDTNGYANG